MVCFSMSVCHQAFTPVGFVPLQGFAHKPCFLQLGPPQALPFPRHYSISSTSHFFFVDGVRLSPNCATIPHTYFQWTGLLELLIIPGLQSPGLPPKRGLHLLGRPPALSRTFAINQDYHPLIFTTQVFPQRVCCLQLSPLCLLLSRLGPTPGLLQRLHFMLYVYLSVASFNRDLSAIYLWSYKIHIFAM
jgi:hypothetical protein